MISIYYRAPNLLISNRHIGGNNNTNSIGIHEDYADISTHTIVNNKFITNMLRYLYGEFFGSRLITNNAD